MKSFVIAITAIVITLEASTARLMGAVHNMEGVRVMTHSYRESKVPRALEMSKKKNIFSGKTAKCYLKEL